VGSRLLAHRDVVPHAFAQVIAAIFAAVMLWFIASGHAGWTLGSFASNGYSDLSPGTRLLLYVRKSR
jgi:aquaporin Z